MSGPAQTEERGTPSIAVVGPGAIGTTVAAALHEVGHTPLVCGRTPRDRLQLVTEDGTIEVDRAVRTDPADVHAPVDLVLLAVKATQLDGAAAWLGALCSPETMVVVLQNGVEQVEMVQPLVGGATVLSAVVRFPAEAQSDGSVRLRGDARLTLPAVDSELVVEAFAGSRVAVETAGDFTTVAWRKLLQNAVAGLEVLTGRRAGMFHRDDIGALALAYLEECLAVARAAGARLDDPVPAEVLDTFRAYPADLGTSILADRVAGRPLEWRVRNDVVRRIGGQHGIPTPISDVLVPLLAAAGDGPG